ncbi:MAG: rhodanese-like domain-containing protein [Patescibacteria group bacterium]
MTVFVDVREVDEFYSDHLPGAINLPLSKLKQGEFGELAGIHNVKLVLYCRSGNRSEIAKKIFESSGYIDVINGKNIKHIQMSKY